MKELKFADLDQRHFGITSGVASYYREVAGVCLSRSNTSPATFEITDNGVTSETYLRWPTPDERELAAHANETDATEAGAYCLAIAAVEQTRSLVAISRAETLTGADYYLAPSGGAVEYLENARRLEVSGIAKGTEAQVASRLTQKVSQAKRGKSDVPAVAAVVGFGIQRILVTDVV